MSACSSSDDPPGWSIVFENLPAGLVSVSGTSATDVWTVGGEPSDMSGPYVLRYDGTSWKKLDTGVHADLWWVFPFPGGPVFIGGSGGTILRYQNGQFEKMTTPGTATVYGIWGTSPTDVWAVGGEGAGAGFIWRYDGTSWTSPPGVPPDLANTGTAFKVWGNGPNDVYIVGAAGLALHWDGTAFRTDDPKTTRTLFTVYSRGNLVAAVGGFGTGVIVEYSGGAWSDVTPAGAMQMNGVVLTSETEGYAAGLSVEILRRTSAGWAKETTGIDLAQDLHAIWVDPSGGVWAVGGQVLSLPLREGTLLHKGAAVPNTIN